MPWLCIIFAFTKLNDYDNDFTNDTDLPIIMIMISPIIMIYQLLR